MTAPLDVTLTRAQRRVFDALCEDGATNPQIADRLNLSEDTVKTHMKAIYTAVGTANRSEVLVRWFTGGFVLAPPVGRKPRAQPQPAPQPIAAPQPPPPPVGPACIASGLPPSMWDGTVDNETVHERRERLAEARAICRTCTLLEKCTADGKDRGEVGQWGDHYLPDAKPSVDYPMNLGLSGWGTRRAS